MSNKTTKRPTISFKGSRGLMDTLDMIAAENANTRSAILETLVTEAVEKQRQKKSPLDIPVNAPADKPLEKNLLKTAKKTPPPDGESFMDWFPNLLGSPKKEGPVGKAAARILERALEDPDKLMVDIVKAKKNMKLLSGLAMLGAALAPVVYKHFTAEKKAEAKVAAAAGTVPPQTALATAESSMAKMTAEAKAAADANATQFG
jgi:hypothetical protein